LPADGSDSSDWEAGIREPDWQPFTAEPDGGMAAASSRNERTGRDAQQPPPPSIMDRAAVDCYFAHPRDDSAVTQDDSVTSPQGNSNYQRFRPAKPPAPISRQKPRIPTRFRIVPMMPQMRPAVVIPSPSGSMRPARISTRSVEPMAQAIGPRMMPTQAITR